MSDVPEELQHLRNIIDSAKNNYTVSLLRKIIKQAADDAPKEDVIRIAEFIYRRGVEMHQQETN